MTVTRPRTSAPRRRHPTPQLWRVGTRGGRAAFLGTGPAAWYDARDLLTSTQQTLTNRVGTSTATLGSTAGSDTNDPVALTHSGTSYVYLPGVGANYQSIPDEAALDITGDIDIRLNVTHATGNPVATEVLASKYSNAGEKSWRILYQTNGTLRFEWSADGSAVLGSTSTTTAPFAGTALWVRVAFDVDNGASGRSVFFYTSTDGTSWAQLGTTVTSAGVTSIFDSNVAVIIGAVVGGASPTAMNVHRAIIKNGIDGTTVLDINPTVETLSQTTWTCTTGQTVTVNRSTSGLTTAVVTRPLLTLDGSDNYLQAPAADIPTFTPTTGAYTVMLVNRVHNLAGAATLSRVWSSESAADNGAHIYLDQTSAQYKVLVGGATTTATTTATAFTQTTQLHAVAAVFDNGTAKAYATTTGLTAGTDYTGVGTITHANPRIGSRADSVASPADLETYAVVHWTRALTETELATAATYLLGTYT